MAELTIQQGDTLGNIALAQGTTVDALLSANPSITDANKIKAGASLTVPGRALSGGAQPAAPGVQPEGRTPVVMDTDGIQQRVSDATGQIEDMGAQVDQRVAQQTERRRVGTPTQELNLLAQEQADIFGDFKAKLTAFEQGAIPLTTDEQASLGAIQGAFDDARKSQLIANRRAEAGGQILQQRTGRARFAPEIAQGEQQSLIDQNIEKLTRLDIQAAGALGDARIAIKQRNFKNILTAQSKLEDSISQRQRTFVDLRNAAMAQAKLSASLSQFGMGGLSAKQRQKLMGDKTALRAVSGIGLIGQMDVYRDLVTKAQGRRGVTDLNLLSRREKRVLQGVLATALGPAISKANDQGALTNEEQASLERSLGPSFFKNPKRIFKLLESTESLVRSRIDTDFDFLESGIPGVTSEFEVFANFIGGDQSDLDFFSATTTTNGANVDDTEFFNF